MKRVPQKARLAKPCVGYSGNATSSSYIITIRISSIHEGFISSNSKQKPQGLIPVTKQQGRGAGGKGKKGYKPYHLKCSLKVTRLTQSHLWVCVVLFGSETSVQSALKRSRELFIVEPEPTGWGPPAILHRTWLMVNIVLNSIEFFFVQRWWLG